MESIIKMWMQLRLYITYAWALLFIFYCFLLLSYVVHGVIRQKSLEKFFLKHGFHRELIGVSRFGSVSFYGWVKREPEYISIDDRDIEGVPVKMIKDMYKNL